MQKILVIDDNAAVRNTLVLILEGEGYDVITAENGRLGFVASTKERPDLVVTDVVMPEWDGIETIRSISEIAPSTKIIAISGGSRTGNGDYLKVCQALGASEVIRKPLDPDEFIGLVSRCLAAG
jgi:CheY-like chemotaxis protein